MSDCCLPARSPVRLLVLENYLRKAAISDMCPGAEQVSSAIAGRVSVPHMSALKLCFGMPKPSNAQSLVNSSMFDHLKRGWHTFYDKTLHMG